MGFPPCFRYLSIYDLTQQIPLNFVFQSSRGAGLAGGDLDRGAERDGRGQGSQRAQETRGKIHNMRTRES